MIKSNILIKLDKAKKFFAFLKIGNIKKEP